MKFPTAVVFAMVGGNLPAQAPFDLDTTFRTDIDQVYVSSVMPLPDGRLVVSGLMVFPGSSSQKRLAALEPDGGLATDFAATGLGGGRITQWNEGKFYVATNYAVRRILPSGQIDPSFIEMSNDPLFTAGQGGDYHLYPDGRVLMTGYHGVYDPVRGFNGLYGLIWFSNTGYYDTTRAPRATDGPIYHIAQLPNGQFYCGGGFTQYEGIPAYALLRVQPDGAYDPSFHTNILWGEPQALCVLPDGRVWVGGDFIFQGGTDTLRLMRFLPDGGLDPTFNTSHTFSSTNSPNQHLTMIINITELDPNRFVVTGYFDRIDSEVHGGIAMFDSTGTLLDNYFQGSSAGTWTYMNATGATVVGITPTGDGDFWIYGSYHGYDDGTTNDPSQRMVSKLKGLSVGVPESPVVVAKGSLSVSPNPSTGLFTLGQAAEQISVYNAQGRLLFRQHDREVDLSAYPPGLYTAVVRTAQGVGSIRLMVQR